MSNVGMHLKSVKQSAEFNTATAKLPRPMTTNGQNKKGSKEEEEIFRGLLKRDDQNKEV